MKQTFTGTSKVILLLLLGLFVVNSMVDAQIDTSILNHKLNNYNKFGLGFKYACLIQKDGKVLYKKDSEDFDVKETGKLGSSSQWLSAALVMWCVDQGKLSLDDKVSDYLPIFTTYGKRYITIRHCLTHQTGIEAQKGVMKLFEKNKFESLEDEANAYASKHEILYNPGTAFTYNYIGINLAARVVEIVMKKGFEQMMAEKILKPLAMKSTSFSDGDRVSPASSAVSNAVDMTNFMTMILNKGVFNGKRILSEKAVNDMETLQMDGSFIKNLPPCLTGFTYGMGEWIMEKDANGKNTVIGFPNMFGTWMFIDRCRGYTCVILPKNLQEESSKDFYPIIKKTIDSFIPDSVCNKQ